MKTLAKKIGKKKWETSTDRSRMPSEEKLALH